MELRELKHIIVDRICIYTADSGEEGYKTLFEGKLQDAPEELLNQDVVLIGVKDKKTLDIEVR